MNRMLVIPMMLLATLDGPNLVQACHEANYVTTDAPTVFVKNAVRGRSIVTSVSVYLAGSSWATDLSDSHAEGLSLTYGLDNNDRIALTPLSSEGLVLRTPRLQPGVHRIVILLRDGAALLQQRTYCVRITKN